MRLGAVSARIGVGVFALLFVLMGTASAKGWYRCLSDGAARPACCCPSDPDPDDGPKAPVVSAARCCDRELLETAGHAVVDSPPTEATPVAPVSMTMAAVLPSPQPAQVHAVRARGEPPTGPLIVLKHSLLR